MHAPSHPDIGAQIRRQYPYATRDDAALLGAIVNVLRLATEAVNAEMPRKLELLAAAERIRSALLGPAAPATPGARTPTPRKG